MARGAAEFNMASHDESYTQPYMHPMMSKLAMSVQSNERQSHKTD